MHVNKSLLDEKNRIDDKASSCLVKENIDEIINDIRLFRKILVKCIVCAKI